MPSNTTLHGDTTEIPPPDHEKTSPAPECPHEPTKDLFCLPIPRRLRSNSDKQIESGIWMNCGIGLAASFLISNLYYCQPLLIQMAQTFDVSYEEVSKIPTLLQTGYAVGIFFISPLGDLIRRRQLLLLLIFATASLTIGLAISTNLLTFQILSFFIGLTNTSAQILAPLAADLAKPEQRSFAYSIVFTGMLSGLLIARVVAGVIAQFASWRVVYYTAVGAQFSILILCYFIIPDSPAKNKHMTYWGILWTMMKYAVTEPLMMQIELIAISTSACFASYWVSLTFLLGGPPYNYSTLVIGLFGLVGIVGVILGLFTGRFIDSYAPWYGVMVSTILLLGFQAIQTGAGGINIAPVIISCIGLDAFRQVLIISMVAMMFSIGMEAVSRLNALFVLTYYIGQIMGTSVGTKVFVHHGWRACAALGMAWYGFQIFVLLLRGPHCERRTWLGYQGGMGLKKNAVTALR
ncbi:hypothetical protein M413DRAFT_424725 [Hebeloma cylindrosporum]|uniref:Major facilitator superfamily (MFS) profile domain-containing protein n=1 Tax=Hebeloma cylindrosporum TaxID=76867 RepID=A0A0C2Y6B3_HEBCY|nr:hypothetical protein M413DRAFT_424725 [Hebeloma cylindrosporum h7]